MAGISNSSLRSRPQDPQDKKWAKEVKERDGHRCVKCGSTWNLQSHHLYQRVARYIHLRHLLENGCLLCFSCHVTGNDAAHKDMKKFRKWYATVSPEFAALYEKQGEIK